MKSPCDFCEENEATHFNLDWDAMLCDPCADAQDEYAESFAPVTDAERRSMGDDMLYPTYNIFGERDE